MEITAFSGLRLYYAFMPMIVVTMENIIKRKTNLLASLIKKTASLLRETSHFYSFFFMTPKEKKSIVFYAERRGHYPYFEGIINELRSKYNQPLSYVTSDPEDPILSMREPGIGAFYFRGLLPIFFSLVKCRVFVMTLTDLNKFYLKRSIHKVHYVYVFHSLTSTHMGFRSGSYDYYDSLLCPGPQQLKEIRKYEEIHKLPRKQLIKAGYYRLERLYDEYHHYNGESRPDVKGTILIAPSWGDKNILESCGERLINILLDANYYVIIRPHSETVKKHPELIESLRISYDDNPHFALEVLSHSNEPLLKADVLISDYSGIALSYAFGTERPVLFLDVPKKIKNPGYTDLDIQPIELSIRSKIGVVLSPDRLEKIPAAIASLIKDALKYKKCIAHLRNEYVYEFGRSSKIGARHIMDIYQGKDGKNYP